MFIVTVKSIDADSFALPTLYGKTTLQKYNFSVNPQEDGCFFSFLPRLSSHVMPARACAAAGIYGCGIPAAILIVI